jgi:ubiquinone/menaquinone biosynthesis C-methylase UbiE
MPVDHFGWIAPYYERMFKPRFNEEWLRLLDLSGRGLMLDIGGGTGRISQYFSDRVNKVILLDESLDMLNQSKFKNTLLPVQSSAEDLPFADATFSRVIMIDAFHHLADQTKAIMEMVRILEPGGRLLIEEPDIHLVGVKLIALFEKVLGMRSSFLKGNQVVKLFQNLSVPVRMERTKGIVWIIADKV